MSFTGQCFDSTVFERTVEALGLGVRVEDEILHWSGSGGEERGWRKKVADWNFGANLQLMKFEVNEDQLFSRWQRWCRR